MTNNAETDVAAQAENKSRRDQVRETARAVLPIIIQLAATDTDGSRRATHTGVAVDYGLRLEHWLESISSAKFEGNYRDPQTGLPMHDMVHRPKPEPTPTPSRSGFMQDVANGSAHIPASDAPAGGLAAFPDLRENEVLAGGPFKLDGPVNYANGHILCVGVRTNEAYAITNCLNNYNPLYEYAAALESRLAGYEAQEVVCWGNIFGSGDCRIYASEAIATANARAGVVEVAVPLYRRPAPVAGDPAALEAWKASMLLMERKIKSDYVKRRPNFQDQAIDELHALTARVTAVAPVAGGAK